MRRSETTRAGSLGVTPRTIAQQPAACEPASEAPTAQQADMVTCWAGGGWTGSAATHSLVRAWCLHAHSREEAFSDGSPPDRFFVTLREELEKLGEGGDRGGAAEAPSPLPPGAGPSLSRTSEELEAAVRAPIAATRAAVADERLSSAGEPAPSGGGVPAPLLLGVSGGLALALVFVLLALWRATAELGRSTRAVLALTRAVEAAAATFAAAAAGGPGAGAAQAAGACVAAGAGLLAEATEAAAE
jgi:hypothetical protein